LDRISCRSALANQTRLILHTGAYWLREVGIVHPQTVPFDEATAFLRSFHGARRPLVQQSVLNRLESARTAEH
jgi:hypothetical protein